jgi:hypothetical protein
MVREALTFCLVVLLGTAVAFAGSHEQFVDVVPAEATSFSSLRDYPQLVAKLKDSPYGQLAEEAEIKAFLESLSAKMSQELSEFREAAEVTLEDAAGLLSGEVAFAVKKEIPVGPDMGSADQSGMKMLLLADVSGNETDAQAFIESILRKVSEGDSGITVIEKEIEGRMIPCIQIPESKFSSSAGGENQKKLDVYLHLEDSTLAAAGGSELLEKYLKLCDGEDAGDSFADTPLYAELAERIPEGSDYVYMENFERYWKVLESASSGQGLGGMNPMAVVQATGVTDMRGHVSSVCMMPDGVKSYGFVLLPAPRRGLFKAFEPPAKASVLPPAFVGKGAAVYGGAYFNVPVLWTEIKEMIRQVSPQAYQQLEAQMNMEGLPFHIENDIINTFGNRWYLYLPEDVVSEDEPREVNALIAASLKEPQTLQKAIANLTMMMGPNAQLQVHNYNGTTINQLPPIPLGTQAQAGNLAPLRICYFFKDGYLFLSSSLALAKSAIDDGGNGIGSLASTPHYQAVAEGLFDSPSSLFYADQRKVGEWIWKLAEKLLDSSDLTLPPYGVIQGYLYSSGFSGRWTDEGIETTGWQPYTEK